MNLKNFQVNKICHPDSHPYLCKGLLKQKIIPLLSTLGY
ncbi:hypothetical protein SPBRAN_1901 [uncultured Candidatus Thioglobus sp.]|nr:hypothetical protein SPBRAN_1901 [uncultured Candidatus Thioglobus sp.]